MTCFGQAAFESSLMKGKLDFKSFSSHRKKKKTALA